MDPRTRHQLSHAVTEYDRRQSTRKGYNPYALSLYLGAVQEIEADVDAGTDLRASIVAHTTGRLATALLKAVGLPALTIEEARA